MLLFIALFRAPLSYKGIYLLTGTCNSETTEGRGPEGDKRMSPDGNSYSRYIYEVSGSVLNSLRLSGVGAQQIPKPYGILCNKTVITR